MSAAVLLVDDAATTSPVQGITPAWRREGTLYVLGFDGMAPHVVDAMLEAGKLPNIARIVREGCSGALATVSPNNSPLIWTSIATGRHHRDHKVDFFHYYRMGCRKVSHYAIRRGPWLKKRVLRLCRRLGLLRRTLFDARDVRARPFWEVLDEAGLAVGVVNWWYTWPVRPLNGFMVADRFVYWRDSCDDGRTDTAEGMTWPAELTDALRARTAKPDEITTEDLAHYVDLPPDELDEFAGASFRMNDARGELRFMVAADRSVERMFEYCLAAQSPVKVAAAYYRAPDIAQHCAFDCTSWAQEHPAPPGRTERFARLVPQAYGDADRIVGQIIDRLGPADSLIALSDHGVNYMGEKRGYGHRYGEPPGVLYALGPEFRAGGRVRGATVYDIAPTVLRLCGVPLAADLEGRSLEDLLRPEYVRRHPLPDGVATYGPRRPAAEAPAANKRVSRRIEDHLRSLGYFE